MTPRERIIRAVNHEEMDFCPYALHLDDGARRRLAEFTGHDHFGEGLIHCAAAVGPDYPETREQIDVEHYRDAYGVIWEVTIPGDYGVVNDPILKAPNLSGYTFPSTDVTPLFEGIPRQIVENPGRYTLWSLGFSLFERAWSLRGLEGFLTDMVTDPRFAHELLDRICEVDLALIDLACEYPIDCVRFGDDWGSQTGLIMGPDLWRRFIKPRFAQLVSRARDHGKHTFLHSDGDISDIIPDLVEVGLDILNPVQPDVMDIYEIKRRFGADLTFLGGISVQQLLPFASPQEVRSEIRRLIREVGRGGGFIISPTHTLGDDIPEENLLVLIEELITQPEMARTA